LENNSRQRVVDATFALVSHAKQTVAEVADGFGLSLPQLHVLQLLDPDTSSPMRTLAEAMRCDPSNVTGITDRLESMGLVERRSAVVDRRIRALVLTEKGRRVRAEALERISRELLPTSLPADDQVRYCELIEKALTVSDE
jgi:DNA-binding MarR family transcriptional regulator